MRVRLLCAMLLLLLAACSGQGRHGSGRLSKDVYLSAVEVIPAPMRNGSSGAPIVGLVVSGTLTNGGKTAMQCTRSEFVLTRPGDNDVAPSTQFCALPSIAPRQSTYFNVTFAAAPRDDWELRFEHADGSYEIHQLAVPPG